MGTAFEAVRKLDIHLTVFCFVVPAQAGTQGFQLLALGPRFRGGDDLSGLRDWFTASFAGVTGKPGSSPSAKSVGVVRYGGVQTSKAIAPPNCIPATSFSSSQS
jgi:hypothetical protein